MLQENQTYNMDCIDGMKMLDDEIADLCITDPPYNVGKEFEEGLRFNYLIRSYSLLVYEKLKGNGWFVFTCPCNKIDYFIEATKSAGFRFERILFYYKKGKFTDVWIGWLLTSEAILIFSKGNPSKSNVNKPSYNHDVYIVKSFPKNHNVFVNHQSSKSEDVWRHIISVLTKGNDLVLDPFMGSGTTAIVCEQLEPKRRWVGFEKNPDYITIINQRLKQRTVVDFTQAPPTVESDNSDYETPLEAPSKDFSLTEKSIS